MAKVTSTSMTAWLAERWAAFRQLGRGHGLRVALDGLALIIEAVVLMISLELHAASPPEPAPDDAPTTAPEPTLIVGGVGAPRNSPLAGAFLGVGGVSAASGIALLNGEATWIK
jgi:hypothetical protein